MVKIRILQVMRGSRAGYGVRTPSLENHKAIGLISYTVPDRLENNKANLPAFNHGWTIIGPPAKRNLMEFHCRADGGPL